MTLAQVERELRILKVYAVVATIGFAAALFVATGHAQSDRQRFREIDVERINVVESNGWPALVLANSQRMPRLVLGGADASLVGAQPRQAPGLIFVDQQGNEVGGLIYGVTVNPDGTYNATRTFTFDQHNQDQILGIQYQDNGRNRAYGLSIWDRPANLTMQEMVEAGRGATDARALQDRLAALARSKGITTRPGNRRVFLGSQDGTPALRLADVEGRERVRIVVDKDNTARMEFLDDKGAVIYSIPQRQP
jgi:hypothetical protein